MGALQALIPLGIITAALGVGGNLLGWVPFLFHGQVCMHHSERARAGPALHVLACMARHAHNTRACARAWLRAAPRRALFQRPFFTHSTHPTFLHPSLLQPFLDALQPPARVWASQRKRHIRDEWAYAMWGRDDMIKKEFS